MDILPMYVLPVAKTSYGLFKSINVIFHVIHAEVYLPVAVIITIGVLSIIFISLRYVLV